MAKDESDRPKRVSDVRVGPTKYKSPLERESPLAHRGGILSAKAQSKKGSPPPPDESPQGSAAVSLANALTAAKHMRSADTPQFECVSEEDFDRWITPPAALSRLGQLGDRQTVIDGLLGRLSTGEMTAAAETSILRRLFKPPQRFLRGVLQYQLWLPQSAPEPSSRFWSTGNIVIEPSAAELSRGMISLSYVGIRFDPNGIAALEKFLATGDHRQAPAPVAPSIEDGGGQTPPARAPSVKAARPPSDDAILAKADEMRGRGMTGYEIAKRMRLEPGFENVATRAVRDLIRGRYPRTGRAGLAQQ